MSRTIKFRAWYENVMRGKKIGDDIVWSKTSYYDYDPIIDNKGLCSVETGWDIQGHEDKNDYILEQYTGLTDKNGREVYEGDIVEQFVCGIHQFKGKKCGRSTIWQVRWNEKECCFELHYIKGSLFGDSMMSDSDEYEVIGNIHENPKLLGGEE